MPNKARNIAATGALWAILSIATYLLLKPTWPVPQILPFELSYLVVPLIASFSILCISSVAKVAIRRKPWNVMVTTSLNGLAIFLFISLVFQEAPVLATFTDISHPLQVIILAITGLALSKESSKTYTKIGLVPIALCGGILGYGLYILLDGLSIVWKPFRYTCLPLLVGSFVASISVLFGLLKDVKHPSISGLSKWISDGSLRNFFLAFVLAGYVFHLRPYVLEEAPLVVILEWAMASLAIAVMYASAKSLSKQFYVESEFADWKKHIQKVERLEGDAFRKELYLQKLFVDQGIKTPLLVHYISSLKDLASPVERTVEAVRQLVAYREAKPIWMALPWVKKKIQKENRNARKQIVEKITETIWKQAGT